MSFDVKTFRRALGCFATGITVVTAAAHDGGEPFGVTVNSFASVSLDPPLVLFCLMRTSRLYENVVAARSFAINILSEDQGPLSMHFASSSSQRRWVGVAARFLEGGTPILEGCLAHFHCTTETIHEAGDHIIVIGRVQSLEWQTDGQPLLYVRGRYGRLADLFVPSADGSATTKTTTVVSGDAVAVGAGDAGQS
jgi:flavin reductase (DIM6/NTAB) family NADH-FMN oxidoreductase RutF